MYISSANKQSDRNTLIHHIQSHPFSTWSCFTQGKIEVNHLPCLIQDLSDTTLTLAFHVARANPIWKKHQPSAPSTFSFLGPNSYISPSWYPAKKDHHKVVPTWNYMTVHAHGNAKLIDDRHWLLRHITDFSNQLEKHRVNPWSVEDAPPTFIDKLTQAIVGFEVVIERLEGRWKLGQNRTLDDQLGLIKGLRAENTDNSLALAQALQNSLQDSAQVKPL